MTRISMANYIYTMSLVWEIIKLLHHSLED